MAKRLLKDHMNQITQISNLEIEQNLRKYMLKTFSNMVMIQMILILIQYKKKLKKEKEESTGKYKNKKNQRKEIMIIKKG